MNTQYNDSTGIIIGCAMRVHSELGTDFQEVIYQRALALEFKAAGLRFEREKRDACLVSRRRYRHAPG